MLPSHGLDGFSELTTNELVQINLIPDFIVKCNGPERGSRQNRHRTEPPIPIKLLSVFDRANNDQPRTKNSVEGFNNALQPASNSHATAWRLIECLCRKKALAST